MERADCTTLGSALLSLCESVCPSVRYQLVKILITLEPYGIFGLIFDSCPTTGMQNGDEALSIFFLQSLVTVLHTFLGKA